MDLQSIKIQKLFGQFDYTISLNREEGITILSGPNGYGKTTILNIVYNFFKQNFFFFQKLNFESITLNFAEDKSVTITKNDSEELVQIVQDADDDDDDDERITVEKQSFVNISFTFKKAKKAVENFIFDFDAEKKLFQAVLKFNPGIRRISQYEFYDSNTGYHIDIENYIFQIPQKPFDILKEYPKQNNAINQLLTVLSSVDVYLIKEQRLLKPGNNMPRRYRNPVNRRSFSYTIQSYAAELKELIHQKQAEAFQESQKLDSTFPNRLIQNKTRLSFDQFDSRFKVLTKKQQRLRDFGITVSDIELTEFNEGKSDVLSVYLDDAEKKTGFFDDLVTKINIFVTIINEKKFAHKKVIIDGDSGFYFVTDKEQRLDLAALSSGEQEEVVIMYELLFKTKSNALIFIDEPEISLHVSWQKVFVSDLLSISRVNNISFLIATHSPQVVNGRWDLTTDLYELMTGEESPERE